MTTLNPGGRYCAYLRKSRRDLELEAAGQGETLARHAQALTDLAARLGIAIAQTYREVVSGDTIAERPEVRRLLDDVNAGAWDGVLVMDVDRLGRGDSIDQGVIMQSFLYSDTLIITPDKIYDPTEDADAEFFEIKLFFSRREYTMIKKRMQRGRLASVMDGCYMGPRPVYGYERYKLPGRKGWSLRIIPERAEIVRSIFRWYAYGMDGRDVGCNVIADRLNTMGLRTDLGNRFYPSYVRHLLQNPTYIGKVLWNQRVTTSRIEDGRRVRSRLPNPEPIIVDGHHEPIIDMELWTRVQAMFASHAKRPKNTMLRDANPFAGLVVCDVCGRRLQLKEGYLFCPTQRCATSSAYVSVVEDIVLEILRGWIAEFEAREADAPPQDGSGDAARAALAQLEDQRAVLSGQESRLYDLLEQGIYSVQVYQQRRAELDARIAELDAAAQSLGAVPQPDPRQVLLPQVRTVLDAYKKTDDPAEKNALLRSVIDHIAYRKTRRCYRNDPPGAHLSLTVYPRTPSDPIF